MSEMMPPMTKSEFIALVEATVERKLLELLADPDSGLELREDVMARLKRQQAAVAAGERGQSFADFVETLDLDG